ncbi:hypothetical protein QTP86_003767 [Hemibagrus guttatus]|nr:hypothetical protein QTP86_003767 [Hemibagrus guttatus]
MRLQVFALLLLSLEAAVAQTQEVCPGTKNGLSYTESSVQHYNNLKERYSGCEIIIGNLEITLMEHNFNFSFLRTVREVTGYVLIATNQFRRLPLQQLRVIRGSTLYDKEWALSVFLNFDGQYGLEDLGLTHLTEILDGGVQIVNNKYLSYAPWINWQDIMKDSSARIDISNNGQKASCHPDCGGYCWGPNKNQCQILTKTVCAPQCHGRCFGPSPQHCCNTECAGGCTGPKETDCFACQHVSHLGACVPHCPQSHIYNKHTFQLEPNPDAMYQYGSICLYKCPTHFVVDGSACVSACPPDKMEVEKNDTKHCEPCNGLCPKVCEGTDTSKSNRQTVDSSNIDSFINCTKIQGSLHFLGMGINGDVYNKIPPLDPEKLKVFSTVREITGILNIQSWPAELKDLSVFSNLTTIRGRSLHLPFSLLVMKVDSLTSLGLRSLQEISDGSVYISNNTNLCYQHTVKWQQIFTGGELKRQRQLNDIKFNMQPSQCVSHGSSQVHQENAMPVILSVYHRREARPVKESPHVAAIVSGVLAGLIVCLSVVVMALLYRRSLSIRRKRKLRRYLENSESIEPLDPGEKGTKVHARILKSSELRKSKLLGSGVFGIVHKGFWIPEGDSVKIPVAIKTIQDRSGHHAFTEITDHMLSIGSLDHPYIVRLLGICPGQNLQLVTQLSTQGSLLQHLRQNTNNLDPQRLLNWCVQIAKGMYYLEEHRMVHRNLAARNVLLKSDYIVQVSDFGIPDLLYPDDKKYVYKTPIKWMALESILFGRYTHQSDVWSYGVTVWEMMSHGAEPYTFMHPNDVPGLLEKGERLAQPQICTIDVYMVMVKCWMIDENIRPTFKELATEFTRMARDPPRYLVIKKEQNSAAADESHLREPKLVEAELESEEDEVLDDGFATPPSHMSPSRSHSRMRIGSYRSASGQSVPVGYLPMTSSTGDDLRQMWPQRNRLGSARTTSESSEGRGTMVDMEMCEIISQTESLRRGHSRGDSAYLSNCVSVTSDPLSPGIEVDEEDSDGYILPRIAYNSGRDALVTRSSSRASLRHIRASRNSKSQPHAIPDLSQEYELMSKQPAVLLHSPGDGNDDGSANLPVSRQSPCADLVTCSSSLSPHEAVHTQTPGTTDESEDKPVPVPTDNTALSDKEASEDNADIGTALEEGQPQQAVVEYEYMDIRNESMSEKAHSSSHEPREDAIYQNTHELSTPKEGRNHRGSRKADEDPAITEQPDEYEDMNACGKVCTSGVRLEYQNFPAKGRMVSGEEPHRVKMRAFGGPCAGVDENNSSTSFDNPDYWHSRLFHKPDAVCT